MQMTTNVSVITESRKGLNGGLNDFLYLSLFSVCLLHSQMNARLQRLELFMTERLNPAGCCARRLL